MLAATAAAYGLVRLAELALLVDTTVLAVIVHAISFP